MYRAGNRSFTSSTIKLVMKRFLILCILIGSFSQMNAQSKPKEKSPTQKEMQEMMKEAQKQLDETMAEMSEEDKKMMDSLGIKMPDMKKAAKDVSKVSDKQLAEAAENEGRIVPKKDAARIAAIPGPVSTAGIGAYIQNINQKIYAALSPALKTKATQLLADIKQKTNDPIMLGKAAVGMWAMGQPEMGLFLQAKLCETNATNSNHLNNYASMLTQLGGAEYAIPLLNNLNSRFKNNSTILNNLGQAWFALGDIPKAEKYIDSTIKIYAIHSQANFTKCLIEESKGKKTEAIVAIKKSMKGGYTKEKETKLKQLGGKPDANNDRFPQDIENDPLQLGGFKAPAYPTSVAECISLEEHWKSFDAEISREISRLMKEIKDMKPVENMQKRIDENIAIITASQQAGKMLGNIESVPLYFERAQRQQKLVEEKYYKKLEALMKRAADWAAGEGATLQKNYREKMDLLRKKDGEQTGYGRPNIDFCPQYKEASDEFLRNFNPKAEAYYKEYLRLHKEFINEISHWQMYMYWPKDFEALKINNKISWLKALQSKQPTGFQSITEFKCASPSNSQPTKLSKFDDVACKYHSETNLLVGKIKSDCSKTIGEFDFAFLKYDIEMDAEEGNTFTEQFVRGSIEITAGFEKEIGPASAEAEVGGRVEFDQNGFKDFIVKGGVSVSNPTGQSAGVEGNVSLVTGATGFGGTGIFGK